MINVLVVDDSAVVRKVLSTELSKAAVARVAKRRASSSESPVAVPKVNLMRTTHKVLAIGASTGGTRAIEDVLIAPGGKHMCLVRSGARYFATVKDGPPVHHQRPSVDVLFHSVARHAGLNAVGAILTGMGADGARGLLAMRQAGSHTIAQDEASCVVFGMPREAIRLDAADEVVSLRQMPRRLIEAITRKVPVAAG